MQTFVGMEDGTSHDPICRLKTKPESRGRLDISFGKSITSAYNALGRRSAPAPYAQTHTHSQSPVTLENNNCCHCATKSVIDG